MLAKNLKLEDASKFHSENENSENVFEETSDEMMSTFMEMTHIQTDSKSLIPQSTISLSSSLNARHSTQHKHQNYNHFHNAKILREIESEKFKNFSQDHVRHVMTI